MIRAWGVKNRKRVAKRRKECDPFSNYLYVAAECNIYYVRKCVNYFLLFFLRKFCIWCRILPASSSSKPPVLYSGAVLCYKIDKR